LHYVVRANSEISFEQIAITNGTPCEVQVKTILQHAYSELTHDTIYKPKVTATPLMLRTAAKSMALIEATNNYFGQVVKQVSEIIRPTKALTDELSPVYRDKVGREPELTRAEVLILDAYHDVIGEDVTGRLKALLAEREFIATRIAEKAMMKLLYRQPSVLFVCLLVAEKPVDTKRRWPLTPDELRPIYVDLGLNFDNL